MRAALVAAALAGLAAALAACQPTVESETYYCGPEASCPPDQVCRGTDNLCVLPGDDRPYACTEGAALPAPGCPPQTLTHTGCVDGASGHDLVPLTVADGCATHVSVTISYPIAFMPLAVTARDPGGAAVATSTPCGPAGGGTDTACVEFDATPGATYQLDVAAADGAPTCDGACAYNRFSASVSILSP